MYMGTLITLYYFPMLPWYMLRTIYIVTMYIRGCAYYLVTANESVQADRELPPPVCEIGDEWQTIDNDC